MKQDNTIFPEELVPLRNLARKLVGLLEDPEPGISTWVIMVGETAQRLQNALALITAAIPEQKSKAAVQKFLWEADMEKRTVLKNLTNSARRTVPRKSARDSSINRKNASGKKREIGNKHG